jgi:hypothetical protein
MAGEENHLNLLNEIFEEAVSLHGEDVEKVVDHVRKKIDAISPKDRVIIEKLMERILLFRPPSPGPHPLN